MKNLIILHGAVGGKDQFTQLSEQLNSYFNVHLIDFSGHGKKGNQNVDFSINLFSEDLENYIKENNLKGSYIFGYSMGGYVALNYILRNPNVVEKLLTLGTKWEWNNEFAAKEIKMLNPENIENKVPSFASTLEQRHGTDNWKNVVNKTANLIKDLGEKPIITSSILNDIKTPVLSLLAVEDKMVTEIETKKIINALPNGFYRPLHNSRHPIEQCDQLLLIQEIIDFFK